MKIILTICFALLILSCKEGFTEPEPLHSVSYAKFKVSPFIYPNPLKVNDNINIYYELSDSCFVNAVILNFAGDVVKTVFDNSKNKKGKYDFRIVPENDNHVTLNSGIYIFSITLDSEINKKVIFEIR